MSSILNKKFNNIVLGWDSDRLADWMECLGYFNVYNIINGWIFKDVVNNILINLLIKCAQANLYTFTKRLYSLKVYRFACAHFIQTLKSIIGAFCGNYFCY